MIVQVNIWHFLVTVNNTENWLVHIRKQWSTIYSLLHWIYPLFTSNCKHFIHVTKPNHYIDGRWKWIVMYAQQAVDKRTMPSSQEYWSHNEIKTQHGLERLWRILLFPSASSKGFANRKKDPPNGVVCTIEYTELTYLGHTHTHTHTCACVCVW